MIFDHYNLICYDTIYIILIVIIEYYYISILEYLLFIFYKYIIVGMIQNAQRGRGGW